MGASNARGRRFRHAESRRRDRRRRSGGFRDRVLLDRSRGLLRQGRRRGARSYLYLRRQRPLRSLHPPTVFDAAQHCAVRLWHPISTRVPPRSRRRELEGIHLSLPCLCRGRNGVEAERRGAAALRRRYSVVRFRRPGRTLPMDQRFRCSRRYRYAERRGLVRWLRSAARAAAGQRAPRRVLPARQCRIGRHERRECSGWRAPRQRGNAAVSMARECRRHALASHRGLCGHRSSGLCAQAQRVRVQLRARTAELSDGRRPLGSVVSTRRGKIHLRGRAVRRLQRRLG